METSFPHYESIGVNQDAQGQLTLLSVVRSLLKFKYTQDIMHSLLICNFYKDQTENNQEKIGVMDFRHSRTANSVISLLNMAEI